VAALPLRFDTQADGFDRRAGLPAVAARLVAEAVGGLAAGDGVLVDVGAGTGEIGTDLSQTSRRYAGLDLSLPMLAVFRRKARQAALLNADADHAWPLADASAAIVFLSRAAHLLEPGHLVEEILRVTRPGGVAVFGSVRREAGSLRQALRRRMRELLREHGVEGRSGRRSRQALVEALVQRGGERLEVGVAASWAVAERAADSLAAWHAKDGLAGHALDDTIRHDVLTRLEAWARERYGDLRAVHESTERYELEAVRLGS